MASKGKNFYDRDLGYGKMMTEFKAAKGESAVFVGFLRSSGTHKAKDKGKPITMAQLGAVHEFGSSDGKIPERSFMRSAVDANHGKLESLIAKLSGQVMDGLMAKKKALGILGETVKQLMKNKIVGGLQPPLKPATIQAKGSSKPLIDTGQLVNSLEWEVREGKDKE